MRQHSPLEQTLAPWAQQQTLEFPASDSETRLAPATLHRSSDPREVRFQGSLVHKLQDSSRKLGARSKKAALEFGALTRPRGARMTHLCAVCKARTAT